MGGQDLWDSKTETFKEADRKLKQTQDETRKKKADKKEADKKAKQEKEKREKEELLQKVEEEQRIEEGKSTHALRQR